MVWHTIMSCCFFMLRGSSTCVENIIFSWFMIIAVLIYTENAIEAFHRFYFWYKKMESTNNFLWVILCQRNVTLESKTSYQFSPKILTCKLFGYRLSVPDLDSVYLCKHFGSLDRCWPWSWYWFSAFFITAFVSKMLQIKSDLSRSGVFTRGYRGFQLFSHKVILNSCW